ncbi:hypothetical protein EZV62_017238 [Acer yangbiense]|uniref:RNA helicase aquarius N-terminal domain-containing protein n=1 Tax=Acer yangbiense TaxID=1000413 RepID=A0A5C7HGV7_9ROSI|nr:hypothetical protein EZV62_017238 [Acer yangbiense]
MILEVSQYLENYLWLNFEAETASFEQVMSMILMVNEKFRENVAAWICFYDRKELFRGFLERVIHLKEVCEHPSFVIFGSLEDEIVSETVLRLASLQPWHSLSYGHFHMELCLNPDLIRRWRRMIKRESKEATKQGEPFDPSSSFEVKFLRNLIEEFLEVLDHKVFPQKHSTNDDDLMNVDGFQKVDDACVLYCERFMEFLIDLLSQLPTRRIVVAMLPCKCKNIAAAAQHQNQAYFADFVQS